MYSGDISRNRSITAQTLTCGTSAIVGMAFRLLQKTMQMFVCSDSGVYVYMLNDKAKDTPVVLDVIPQYPTRCCLLQSPQHGDSAEGHFMVGRDDVTIILLFTLVYIENLNILGGLLLQQRWQRALLCLGWGKVITSMVSIASVGRVQTRQDSCSKVDIGYISCFL